MGGPREQRRGGSTSQAWGGHAEMGTPVKAVQELLVVQIWKQLHPAAVAGIREPAALRKSWDVCQGSEGHRRPLRKAA